ncbi:acetyl-CoA carboxylase biotin carboxyl carrier protein [Urbifossiella limnaea]|uniref:Biotin carboxyl carrier protein of acetyl-CoA carboxylase n=1 Tax=Urbifossiella limnaea TaxID=2528023 RepID=A0A517XMN8_9BACT|nr:biotin/lipoyl-containing protein [Urbifossiella limnaea]QDU18761.1 Acetyl-CoA biotin carboxyl carrier [Urbifossiella limnaea]
MADDKRDAPRPFDVKTVEYLLKLMSEHELSEIDLKEADQRIRLRKGGDAPVMVAAPVHAAHAPAPAPAAHAPASPPPHAAPAAKKGLEIKSELIGTFYTRPAPDKPEFVKVGSRVTPDTTVCIVMAMKVNNEIKAGVSGTVTEVVAKNEDFVDFNTVLFRVDPG